MQSIPNVYVDPFQNRLELVKKTTLQNYDVSTILLQRSDEFSFETMIINNDDFDYSNLSWYVIPTNSKEVALSEHDKAVEVVEGWLRWNSVGPQERLPNCDQKRYLK